MAEHVSTSNGRCTKSKLLKCKSKLRKKYIPRAPMDTNHSIVSLDCEMVGVRIGKKTQSALGRCSIVSYNETVLFDEFIKPKLPIVDYRYRWSGIKPVHMKSAIPMDAAIPLIKTILEGKILIGHSLKHDFEVLHFHHPEEDTRDTSLYKSLRIKAGLPDTRTPSLKNLSLILLEKEIQSGPHDSVQDALATLQIYKLCEKEWEAEIKYSKINWFDDKYWPPEIVYGSFLCS